MDELLLAASVDNVAGTAVGVDVHRLLLNVGSKHLITGLSIFFSYSNPNIFQAFSGGLAMFLENLVTSFE